VTRNIYLPEYYQTRPNCIIIVDGAALLDAILKVSCFYEMSSVGIGASSNVRIQEDSALLSVATGGAVGVQVRGRLARGGVHGRPGSGPRESGLTRQKLCLGLRFFRSGFRPLGSTGDLRGPCNGRDGADPFPVFEDRECCSWPRGVMAGGSGLGAD